MKARPVSMPAPLVPASAPGQRGTTLRRRVLAIAGLVIRTAGQWGLTPADGWAARADLARARQHLATLGPERRAARHPRRTAARRSLARDPPPAAR